MVKLKKYKLADLKDRYVTIVKGAVSRTYLVVPINDTEGVGIFLYAKVDLG